MTVADATPDLEHIDQSDRAFIGHPKGLGYLGFTEACERFSYYSMQTLLTLYMVNYLLLAGHIEGVAGLGWLREWHYPGLEGQPLASAIFGDYTSLVYLMPILGGIIADKLTGRRVALIAGGLVMALGHFLMAIEGAFLFALLALIVGVGLFKGNIATQVGELYGEHDLRRAMAFQIFYIFINVSVIAAPLISGTLGQEVGWHYGFGCAGVVMVLGLGIYLSGQKWLPADLGVAQQDRSKLIGRVVGGAIGIAALVILWLMISGILFSSWVVGTISALALIALLYWFLTRNLGDADKSRVLSLCILIPVLAIALLTNQEIFNAYLIWGDQQFNLTFMGRTLPSSWLITLDAILSFSMLVAVAAFWKWWSFKRREPDEISKMIIGSLFTIAGGLCLFMAALTQPEGGKIGLFWPVMFHLMNSIGFAHILPISLALFTKIAPKQITATVIGLYYLSFFAANKAVGYVGGLYSSLPTTTFWLLHIASAAFGLVAFIVFKMMIGKRMTGGAPASATA
ncbi:peptide MFS transporter [Sphingomonas sediminicola]|jgi:POT family proton-dependent oligopeptide transporter|uniref:Peptide MFS transporter n=1 Tax=Sphingomonas sediminicola TaxID=386874 RepID=A0ABX6T6Y6_9SPHN|nr:peptide MFS transporter [Sphingomonas sediminicola]QNP45181.1 peptide MFS transporter [Sphingomonas sediminicola]